MTGNLDTTEFVVILAFIVLCILFIVVKMYQSKSPSDGKVEDNVNYDDGDKTSFEKPETEQEKEPEEETEIPPPPSSVDTLMNQVAENLQEKPVLTDNVHSLQVEPIQTMSEPEQKMEEVILETVTEVEPVTPEVPTPVKKKMAKKPIPKVFPGSTVRTWGEMTYYLLRIKQGVSMREIAYEEDISRTTLAKFRDFHKEWSES